MLKRLLIFIETLLVLLLLCGCAGSSLSSLMQQPETVNREAAVAVTSATPKKIALLLPLKGEMAPNSQAIKNGFLAAYYQARENNPDLDISVIDTSQGKLSSAYQQAISSGADFIVGPLTKQEVEQVSNIGTLSVPTIALNTLDNYRHHNCANNLYQFGLLPQDEAVQTAEKMHATGLKNVAIIAPAGSWGDKIVATFRDKFEGEGGKVVAIMNYGQRDNFTSEVCQLVTANPETMCVHHKNKSRNQITIERRTDVDSFFLVANPVVARQIIPLLKYYYAGDLPVFAISSVYSGNPQASLDQDLNGVIFCDMPWVLPGSPSLSATNQTLRSQLQASWCDSFASQAKLYALGVDSFMVAMNLKSLLAAPQSGMQGVTGKLYLDNHDHIYRQLECAQFRDGVPVVLSNN